MRLKPSWLSSETASQLVARLEREAARRRAENSLAHYAPYPKQREFHAAGATKRERLFMAGNQLGKTYSGAAESAYHLTGLYPDWWDGYRFNRPTTGWVAGLTGEATRDNPQRLLCGRAGMPEAWGTGSIPKALLVHGQPARGVPGLLDHVRVKHVTGGVSSALFKSYEKGRAKWQGDTIDFLWNDEEPPLDVYSEGMTRTNAVMGPVYTTFTPLLGMSDVVVRFLKEDSPDRAVTTMTIDDVEHYSAEDKRKIIDSYPAHEREARTKGIPIMGSGRVFPVEESMVFIDPIAIPPHWVRINGLDFGWDHPFAATSLAWDREADVIYVVAEYRQKETTPIIHAAAVKPWGDWIPCAWPHDGLQHDKGSGEELARQYRAQGLAMTAERATFVDGGNGVEAGIYDMLDRMLTGRWKVFKHLVGWLDEFRLYHRKDGQVVKERDDLISSSRYALMMKRFATTKPTAYKARPVKGII